MLNHQEDKLNAKAYLNFYEEIYISHLYLNIQGMDLLNYYV